MQKDKYTYTYTAPTEEERRQIERIRREYTGKVATQDGFFRLKSIEKTIKKTSTAVAVSIGTVGVLLFGGGMSAALVWQNYILGIGLSAVGTAVVTLAHPIYKMIKKSMRKKRRQEVLSLSAQLLGEED